MILENGIETCKLSYVKWIASPGLMHDTGCLGLVHWDDPERLDGEGGGFRIGKTCIPMADSSQCMAKPIHYCTVISLQLKWIHLLKKEEWNNAIYSNMYGPRDCHTEWNKSEKEKYPMISLKCRF